MANCTNPTIVAINGPAAGFGFTITFPATIRVAWSGAKLSLPFSRLGLTLESCSAFFHPRLIGLVKATHISTTGATYVASDPLVSSLFLKLFPTPQETAVYAIELAAEMAENTSLTSTKLIRDLLLHSRNTPGETHVLDSKAFIAVFGSKKDIAGIKGVLKKKKPELSGAFDQDSSIAALNN